MSSLVFRPNRAKRADPPPGSDWKFRRGNETLIITSNLKRAAIEGSTTKIPFSPATGRVKTILDIIMTREEYVADLIRAGWKQI